MSLVGGAGANHNTHRQTLVSYFASMAVATTLHNLSHSFDVVQSSCVPNGGSWC